MMTPREALLVTAVLELILFELKIVEKPGSGLEALHTCLKESV
jgi:hypothetical protein